MNERQKLAAAAAGGYVAGRMKKGKQAVRLVMWLSGDTSGPKAIGLAKQGLQSAQAQELLSQVRGPLMEAAQAAALQVITQRITNLSGSLTERTQALTDLSQGVAQATTDTVTGTADTATKAPSKLKEALSFGRGKKDKDADKDKDKDDKSEESKSEDSSKPEEATENAAPAEAESEPEPAEEPEKAKADA